MSTAELTRLDWVDSRTADGWQQVACAKIAESFGVRFKGRAKTLGR